jgi:Tol biopolymer transport system component
MGEVYRARDTKLNRDVALKVLPEAFTLDGDRIARFRREAQVLASLNHPNIAAIYGFEDSGSTHALVLELVEGPTLADRIAKGPIALDEALPIAKQIAEALEAAHEQGIIHRDLKPANIKVRDDGTVKVLDFGLAKALEPATAASAALANSPTITTPAMTQMGVILGTAAYMSPEQAKGRPADRRSDVWAFGCVLFEMLTGKRAFAGSDVSETLAAILMREPDWAALPPAVPRRIATVIKQCLQKDRKDRIPDVSAARFLIAERHAPASEDAPTLYQSGPTARAAFVVAALAALAFAGLALVHFREKPPAAPEAMRFQINMPEKTTVQKFAVSPDGRALAFYAIGADGVGAVWVHSFISGESKRLAETAPSPSVMWSPDSRFVAYPGGSGLNRLMKVEMTGGLPQTICEIKGIITGGSWSADGVIVFGTFGGGTWRVSAAGGEASPLTALDPSRRETGHSTPLVLPDGKHFLYLRNSGVAENAGIYVGALDATPQQQAATRLVATGFSAAYAPSPQPNRGHVLFLRDDALWAQPFDVSGLRLAGEAVRIADHVGSVYEFGYVGVSSNGVLAYRTGGAIGANPLRLTWFNRQGTNLGTAVAPGYYTSLRLSPDGSQLAASRLDVTTVTTDIWMHEFARGASTRLTSDKTSDGDPIWSPDGSRVAYASSRSGGVGLYQRASNGAGGEELLLPPDGIRDLDDWSNDGRFLLYSQQDSTTKADLWVLPLAGDRKPAVYLNSEFSELQGQFSPDGHLIAYASDESGRMEIYVRPFPLTAGAGKWIISNGGGLAPRWRRDGKELLFLTLDLRTLMAAAVSDTPAFKAGVPVALFGASVQNNIATGGAVTSGFNWDVTADGKKFLLATIAREENQQSPITVVLNWTEELKQRVR